MGEISVNQLYTDMQICKKLCEEVGNNLKSLTDRLSKLELQLEHINITSVRNEKDILKIDSHVESYREMSLANRQSLHDIERDFNNTKDKLTSINNSTMTTDDNLSRLRTEVVGIKESLNRMASDISKIEKELEELERSITQVNEDANRELMDFKKNVEERLRILEDNSLTVEVFKRTIIGAIGIIGALSGLFAYFV